MILRANPELEPDDVRSTSMGNQGEDIQLSPAARKLFPFYSECKSRARVAVFKDMEQAQGHGDTPVVFLKQNRSKPLALLDAEAFVALVRKAYG